MNRLIRSFLLICVFLPLYSTTMYGQEGRTVQFFRSNGLGMELEEIEGDPGEDSGYVLEKKIWNGGVENQLYLDGQVIERRVLERKGEVLYGRCYRRGVLVEETITSDGLLLEEKSYEKGEVTARRYAYDDGALVEMEIQYPDGTRQRREYLRGEDGDLLRTFVHGSDEDGASNSVFDSGVESRNVRQWHLDTEGCIYFFSQEEGVRLTEKYCDGELVYGKTSTPSQEGVLENEIFPTKGREVETRYDSEGRRVWQLTIDGESRKEVEYEYRNGLLRLVEESVSGVEDARYHSRYYYHQDEEDWVLIRKKTWKNGILHRTVSYMDDEQDITIYRRGEPVVVLKYKGEDLVERRSLIGDEE